jgi:hypothetical protein
MALWNGPTVGRGMTSADLITSALDQPMSLGATLWDQAKGGVLESFGLGTVARESMLPPTMADPNSPVLADRIRSKNNEGTAISEDEFKASPSYRVGVPYDTGMTAERQAALAEMYDIKKAREFYAGKRPITAFIGNLAGQATDPINYVPFLGPATKAAAVARFGRIGGTALVASADAAINTAVAAGATAGARARFGDDVSWETSVSQIATAALIGGAFGTVAGAMGRRADVRQDALVQEAEQRLATLRRTQESRVALNDAVQSLAIDGEVRLSPTSVGIVQRTAADVERISVRRELDAPSDLGAYIDADTYRKRLSAPYVAEDGAVIASSRLVPNEGVDVPVGTWRVDKFSGNYGKEIEQLREVRIDELALPELREGGKLDIEKLGDDERYAAWIKEGKEPPPIEVLRRDDGSLRVADGHRRVLAAKLAGRATIKAWVSETVPIPSGRLDANGKPIMTSLTYELAMKEKDRVRSAVASLGESAEPAVAFGDEGSKAAAQIKPIANDNAKAVAEQYGVNAETGDFVEAAELDALRNTGRLTEDEIRMLDEADQAKEAGDAFAEALKAAVGCML